VDDGQTVSAYMCGHATTTEPLIQDTPCARSFKKNFQRGVRRGGGDLYRHTKMALVEDFESKSLLARGGLRLHVRASAFRVGTELLVLQIARAEWERGALPHKSTMLCTLWPARPATAGVRPASGTPLVPMQRSLCASHLQGIWFVVTP